jgi:hypothetical protein
VRALQLAQVVISPGRRHLLTARRPAGDAGREGAFGVVEPACEPPADGEVPTRHRVQHRLAVVPLGQRPCGKRGGPFGVTAEMATAARSSAIAARTLVSRLAARPTEGS